MKLIYCPHCHDIIKLRRQVSICECGLSHGAYHSDGLNAVYSGDAVPLGIANSSFIDALEHQPEKGIGARFEAFVIPSECPTFKRSEYPDPRRWRPQGRPTKPCGRDCNLYHPAPDEEITLGGTIQKTKVKRGPHRGIQPKR